MCLIYFLLDKKCNSILPDQREDCGYYGIGQEECEKVRDCCFDETISNVPWCFKPGGEEPAEESNEGSIESFAWGDYNSTTVNIFLLEMIFLLYVLCGIISTYFIQRTVELSIEG